MILLHKKIRILRKINKILVKRRRIKKIRIRVEDVLMWKIHTTTALRAACIHRTIGDSHGTRKGKTSSLRRTLSTWKISMRAGTMTTYCTASMGGNYQKRK